MKAPSKCALEGLTADVKNKLQSFKKLVDWLHSSDYAAGCENELSFNADYVLEQGKDLLERGKAIFLEYQENNPKWRRKAQSQFNALKRFLSQLGNQYDELEYVRSLRQEALEGGNPFMDPCDGFINRCETFWTDELACANSIRPRDDTT